MATGMGLNMETGIRNSGLGVRGTGTDSLLQIPNPESPIPALMVPSGSGDAQRRPPSRPAAVHAGRPPAACPATMRGDRPCPRAATTGTPAARASAVPPRRRVRRRRTARRPRASTGPAARAAIRAGRAMRPGRREQGRRPRAGARQVEARIESAASRPSAISAPQATADGRQSMRQVADALDECGEFGIGQGLVARGTIATACRLRCPGALGKRRARARKLPDIRDPASVPATGRVPSCRGGISSAAA